MVGYHGHAAADNPEVSARTESFQTAMAHSRYNSTNVDIGHGIAGNGYSPAEFIKKHPNRISSLHIKDRKKNQGEATPWGEGDTPIKEILQLTKGERYDSMATTEMEHRVPEDSDVMTQIAKYVQFCRDALTSRKRLVGRNIVNGRLVRRPMTRRHLLTGASAGLAASSAKSAAADAKSLPICAFSKHFSGPRAPRRPSRLSHPWATTASTSRCDVAATWIRSELRMSCRRLWRRSATRDSKFP